MERNKKGQFVKGHNPYNYWLGKERDIKTKEKLREANFGKKYLPETNIKKGRKGENHPLYGKHHTEKAKRKIKEARKKQIIPKGELSPLWQGGLTPKNKQIWRSIEMKLWRLLVFERDNFTCQKCKEGGGKLHPHHIQNFSQYPELRFMVDNGITMCIKCHTEFHKIYGKQNNTKEQLEEFLAI